MFVLSLFDGISTLRYVLEELKIPIDKYYCSEIDKHSIGISRFNYPDNIHLGDVREIGKKVPYPKEKIDLITFGFPCTDLSIAGKREGLKGKQSSLIFEAIRIINDLKPKYFLCENVASMSKANKAQIDKLLWGINGTLINSNLVSAQVRKRLFWFGEYVDGTYQEISIPQPQDRQVFLCDILDKQASQKDPSLVVPVKNIQTMVDKDIVSKQNKTVKVGDIYQPSSQGGRIYSINNKGVTLSSNGGGRGAKTGLYLTPATNKIMQIEDLDCYYNFKEIRTEEGKLSRRLIRQQEGRDSTRRDFKSKMFIPALTNKANCLMTSLEAHNLLYCPNEEFLVRKLSPLECERLQTLPDGFTKYGLNDKGEKYEIPKTCRYKALGNGWTAEVIKFILSLKNLV